MSVEEKHLRSINSIILKSSNEELLPFYPVTYDDIFNSLELCEKLIDFLTDCYVCSGMDKNYEENDFGKELDVLIQYVATINGLR